MGLPQVSAEGKLQKDEIEVSCTMGERIFTTKFSIGERIRLTKNDYRKGFTNGDLGELIEIIPFENGDRQFRIKLDRGEMISFLVSEYSDENNNLFIFGAGHVGQALSTKSLNLNFNVSTVSPKSENATSIKFVFSSETSTISVLT